MKWLRAEVPLLLGLVQAVTALVIAFGVTLTQGQIGSILAASAALLAVVTRTQVTPKNVQ